MSTKLSSRFIDEMIGLCLESEEILNICLNKVEFSFFPEEGYKKVWKYIKNHYQTNRTIPTIGILSQVFNYDEVIISFLSDIKNTKLPAKQEFLTQFDSFIIESKFLLFYEEIGKDYNQGISEKEIIAKTSAFIEDVNSFSTKFNYYEPVFKGYVKRQEARVRRQLESFGNLPELKAQFGIDEWDYYCNGGLNTRAGDTALILAQSGVGKSTLARSIGVHNARRGMRVAHFQLEGSKEECEDAYDATWIGCSVYDVENVSFDEKKKKQLLKVINSIGDGEIYVESFEEFGSGSMVDIGLRFEEMEKLYGKFGLIIIDYLEKAQTGDGRHYKLSEERFRREAIADAMKNLAIKTKTALITFTQGSTIDPTLSNDPKWYQTRYNVAECKGLVRPFSVFATINQTSEEYENNIIRIYLDKLRKSKAGKLFKIATHFETQRFYDRKRTLSECYTEEMRDLFQV